MAGTDVVDYTQITSMLVISTVLTGVSRKILTECFDSLRQTYQINIFLNSYFNYDQNICSILRFEKSRFRRLYGYCGFGMFKTQSNLHVLIM